MYADDVDIVFVPEPKLDVDFEGLRQLLTGPALPTIEIENAE